MVGLLVEMLRDVKDAPFADLRHADDLSPSRFHVAPEKPDPGPQSHTFRLSSRVTTYSWIVLAVVALSGVCNLSRIVMDLNWLATTAAKLPM